jgi:CelD/BcsL family acetyltransferase involved in cellulose biosynthesis
LAALEELAPEWAALCAAAALPPLVGPAWIAAHVRAYEREQQLRILAVRDGSRRLLAVAPFVDTRALVRGFPVRMLRGAGNQNTVRFDFSLLPGPAGEAGLDELWRGIAAGGGWNCLMLPETPAGGAAQAWCERARAAGYLVGRWQSKQAPFVAVGPATAEAEPGFEQTSRDFRAKLRWSRRRLEEQGPLRCERELHPGAADLEEFFALEAAGWKGHAADGNAVLRKGPRARHFFQELAARAGAAGQFALHRLRRGDRVIAMSLGLFHEHGYYLVKTTYDEHYGRYSPGHLLTEELVRECAAAARPRFDFCGEAFAYEARWTRRRLPHAFLWVFPPTPYGRWLHSLKFGPLEQFRRQLRPSH